MSLVPEFCLCWWDGVCSGRSGREFIFKFKLSEGISSGFPIIAVIFGDLYTKLDAEVIFY